MSKKRISLLDSFRALSILAVALFHYTYFFNEPDSTPAMYPYGSFYGGLFAYGFYGVEFFFCISGFVISYTLENTDSYGSFWKNRLIRLMPPMLLCSLTTFCLSLAFDNKHLFPYAHDASGFLPSLTFTKPELWRMIISRRLQYIDLVYWSLWVEMQFYIVAAALFYVNKRTFLRNIVIFALVLNLLNWIPTSFMLEPAGYHVPGFLQQKLIKAYQYSRIFDLRFYISWFAMGAFFHQLFIKRTINFLSFTGIGIFLIFANQLYLSNPWPAKVIFVTVILLFLAMIYKRDLLSFLDKRLLWRVGALSYTIYLIHSGVGLLFINRIGPYFGKWSPITPFIALLMSYGFAELSYRLYEKRVSALLKRWLFKPVPASSAPQTPITELAPDSTRN
jgi:peptidoglycan/LPS O-acetylase OafA/YrhL